MSTFGDASMFRIAAFTAVIVTFIFDIVGFAAPYWIYMINGSEKVYMGLWQYCRVTDTLICTSTTSKVDFGWFKAVGALNCIGFVLILFSMIFIITGTFCNRDNKAMQVVCVLMLFLAASCIFISVIIFGVNRGDIGDAAVKGLNFAYAFCVTAVGGAGISGLLLLLDIFYSMHIL